MNSHAGHNAAIVAIGRNEGDRLRSCLQAACGQAGTVVYVDSGSMDGSPEYAASLGCLVVKLDPLRPFSAARARNEGFARACDAMPGVRFVQLLDGDSVLAEGWLQRGVSMLMERPDAAIVCGHVKEIHPEATVFNKLIDLEWQKTPGEILTCVGTMLVRAEVFKATGGFRPDVIAAEDDEFCLRVREAGWKIVQLDAVMARHDAAITRLSQWWRRSRRMGHAYAQVAALHGGGKERYFVADRRKILFWGLALPAFGLLAAPFTRGLSLAVMLLAYALQFARIVQYGRGRGWSSGDAASYAFFTVISRFPALQGLMDYYWRRWRGRAFSIIEYKGSTGRT